MATSVHIRIGRHQLEAEIFDTPTGVAILKALPFETEIITWGDEIYFRLELLLLWKTMRSSR